MNSIWREFIFAARSLTRIPIPLPQDLDEEEKTRSLLYHPLVGLALGVILLTASFLFSATHSGIAAAVVLIIWVAITGLVHFEGYANTVSGWLKSKVGDAITTQDSSSGISSNALLILAIVLLLLVKYSGLNAAFHENEWSAVIVACVLARTAVTGILFYTPYVPPTNFGGITDIKLEKQNVYICIAVSCLVSIFAGGLWVFVVILIGAAVAYWIRLKLIDSNDGISGNECSALIEIFEAGMLWLMVL